jgi:hypothetical protein
MKRSEINAVKDQVSAIVNYAKATTREEVNQLYHEFDAKIQEGINKMSKSVVWKLNEVDEIEEYANLILELRKNDALATINKAERENWVF